MNVDGRDSFNGRDSAASNRPAPDRSPLAGQINHSPAGGWICGPGTAERRLAGLLSRVDSTRPLLLSTPSLAATPLLEQLQAVIGPGLGGTFAESCQHTPRDVVFAAVDSARALEVDGIVAFGGSSVVDLGKAVALVLAEGSQLDGLRVRSKPGDSPLVPRLRAPKIPQIAVPTTLSGAEFTGAVGITDTDRGEKDIYLDTKLVPAWVILDAGLTTATPARLWAATGMKVVADAIETMSSLRRSPYTDALALGALELLIDALPSAVADTDDVEARSRCLYAVAMVLPNLQNAGLGLTAALRHQIGGGHGVPHGEASTIVLPHVLRWNEAEASPVYDRISWQLGFDNGLPAAVEDLIARLGLPTRLSQVGLTEADLPAIAEHALGDLAIQSNPRPARTVADVLEILRAAL